MQWVCDNIKSPEILNLVHDYECEFGDDIKSPLEIVSLVHDYECE